MKRIFPALALLATLVFPVPAQSSSPLSTVQLEKLVKRIENKGHDAQLTAPVASALGLGDGTTALVKSINNYNPGTGKHYTFGIVVGAGYYLATLSDGSSPHIFLFDRDLKTVKAQIGRAHV